MPDLLVSTVGLITTPSQAESILSPSTPSAGTPDIITLGREFLRDVDFPIKAAEELGVVVKPVNQYERAWTRMTEGHHHVQPAKKMEAEDVEGEEGVKHAK